MPQDRSVAPARGADFEALLRPHLETLFCAALEMSGGASDAEDLVQESVVKGLRRLDSFRSGTDFRAWMMRILANTRIDLYRRRRHERPASAAEAVETLAAAGEGPRSAACGFPGEGDVERALSRLPGGQRAAVVLVDVTGLTNQEAAEALGWPLGTVNSRVCRGRAQLRSILLRAAERPGGGVYPFR